MALVPIEVFSPQQTGVLGQIIGQGQTTIANALQNIFNVGRDLANNQVRSERDFLAERTRLDAIDERRAENMRQQGNLDRNFLRGAFESDRSFDASQDARAFQEERLIYNDAFAQSDSDRRFANDDLRLTMALEDQEFQREERGRVAGERERMERFNQEVAQPPGFFQRAASQMFDTPAERAAVAKARADAARATGDASSYIDATRALARDSAGVGSTPADIRSNRRLQLAEESAARSGRTEDRAVRREEEQAADRAREREIREAERLVKPDTEAFPRAMSFVETKVEGKNLVPKNAADQAAFDAAAARDEDAAMAELEAARNSATFEQYLLEAVRTHDGNGKPYTEAQRRATANALPESVKRKRRKMWDLAHSSSSSAAATSPATRAEVDLDSLMD